MIFIQNPLGVEHRQLIVAPDHLPINEDLRRCPTTGTRCHGVPLRRVPAHRNFTHFHPFTLEQSLCPVAPGSLGLGIHLNVCWHTRFPLLQRATSLPLIWMQPGRLFLSKRRFEPLQRCPSYPGRLSLHSPEAVMQSTNSEYNLAQAHTHRRRKETHPCRHTSRAGSAGSDSVS
jgi:hypothetical protein